MKNSILAIAIPFYNGFDTTKLIIDELNSGYDSDFEIVISDDCSELAESSKLLNYIESNFFNSNIKYFRNSNNLGMDSNFQKCIELSNSSYTWFMGQDDFIFKNKLIKVIEYLKIYNPNIVYLNYLVNRTWNYKTTFVHTNNSNIEYGDDVDEFYHATRGNLPHFLPSLIVKTDLWPEVNDLKPFMGTYFIQLGAFLTILSKYNKWLYIGEPMSIGLIPTNGWQSSIEKKIRIYVGFMDCIKKTYNQFPILSNIFKDQYFKNYYQHFSLSVEGKLSNSVSINELLRSKLIFTSGYRNLTKFVDYTPNIFLHCFIYARSLYFYVTNLQNEFKSLED